jgi:hypothetical protein
LKGETRSALDEVLQADESLRESMAAAEQLFRSYVSGNEPHVRQ